MASPGGAGPDDLPSYSASDLPADTATEVSVDGVGTRYHADLSIQTTTSDGDLVSSPTQRTPADLTPGSYTITFTQPGSDGGADLSLTTPSFTIRSPGLYLPPYVAHPGEWIVAYLVGTGPQVRRTVAVDGRPVAGTAAEDGLGVTERLTLPTTITIGDTVAITLRDGGNDQYALTTTANQYFSARI